MAKRLTNEERLYRSAVERAKAAIGGPQAFRLMGSTIRRALVAQEILQLTVAQEDSTSAETVRRVAESLYSMLCDDEEVMV